MRHFSALILICLLSSCGQAPTASNSCSVSATIINKNIVDPCLSMEKQLVAAWIQDHGSKDCLADFYDLVSAINITPGPTYSNPYATSQKLLASLKSSFCSNNCVAGELSATRPTVTGSDLAEKIAWICN